MSAIAFPDHTHFEDFKLGDRFEYGSYTMQAGEMIAFAEKYDPEPFHLDAGEAVAAGFPGLIASGPMIGAIWRRMSKDAFGAAVAFVSPGWEEIRWLKPVLPDDVLTVRAEVIKARVLKSRPALGYLQLRNEILRQGGDTVASIVTNWFIYRRSGDAAGGGGEK